MKIALFVAPLALALAACATPSPDRVAENRSYCGKALAKAPPRVTPSSQPRVSFASDCNSWNRSDRIALDNWQNLATHHGESALP